MSSENILPRPENVQNVDSGRVNLPKIEYANFIVECRLWFNFCKKVVFLLCERWWWFPVCSPDPQHPRR
jgi:hypothetical protein